jgi:putative endonuclease
MSKFTILKAKHLKRGRQGERIARRFLRNKFYDIFMMNYKVKKGEIDIIARDGETLCFVEVKTRKYSKEKINDKKVIVSDKQIKRIQNASKDYLYEIGNPEVQYRYELIEIFLTGFGIKTIYHWKDNFGK